MNPRIGKLAYGGFFTVLLPILLVVWSWRLDHSGMLFWPLPFKPSIGVALIAAGLILLAISMQALWRIGKGWPMNAYPPTTLVMESSYRFFSHPIYLGFSLACFGTAIISESPAGFWVVCPITALATVALVAGYEGPQLNRRFGKLARIPTLIGIPPANSDRSPLFCRAIAAIIGLVPWGVCYSVFSTMPEPPGASNLRMAWEAAIPRWDWMFFVYSAAYPVVIAAPFLLQTNAELRRFVLAAWIASFSGLLIILTLPGKASLLVIAKGSQLEWLANANRALDADWLAFPSFHALWIVLAGYCFTARFPRFGTLWALTVTMICVSCLLTGSHAIVDVLGGAGLGMLCWQYKQVWQHLVSGAEVLSNSWNSLTIGPVRIISHAIWSAKAAAIGLLVVVLLLGPEFRREIATTFIAGLLAAGAWGYWLEGGHRLSRPFGYFGFLFGSIAAFLTFSVGDPDRGFLVAAAFAVAAPIAQAIGRIRCLIQGCCHGRPVGNGIGLRVIHPDSRVTALSGLRGMAIHPTQVYSMLGNFFLFAALWRLWHVGATPSFVCSLYLVFSALIRFVEEQFRGEPQTPTKSGLSIYQWLAVFLFAAGILLGMLPGQPIVPRIAAISMSDLLLPLTAGILAAFFMSVDFPNSSWRFSRLTVNSAPKVGLPPDPPRNPSASK